MIQVKIGGVPEHFNYPWYLTLKDKLYQKEGINLRWEDFPGGTGQMNQALREGRIDLAVILTEGVVRDIVHGNPARIVQVFVNSPLLKVLLKKYRSFKENELLSAGWVPDRI